jgi:hypothetical protein
MRGIKSVNRALGRKGQVVGDRYHARALTTPRQMRISMVYVLLKFRKHLRAPACVDPRSSGPHFGGWQRTPVVSVAPTATAPPATWMARIGWRRAGGPLRVEEHPASACDRAQLEFADVGSGLAGRRELEFADVGSIWRRGDITSGPSSKILEDVTNRERAG